MELRKAILRTLCVIGLLQILVIGVMATPINFGDTVTGTISTLGQTNSYTFNATAGDTIYTRMSSSWDSYPQIRLYDPNGNTIATSTGTLGYYATDLTQDPAVDREIHTAGRR